MHQITACPMVATSQPQLIRGTPFDPGITNIDKKLHEFSLQARVSTDEPQPSDQSTGIQGHCLGQHSGTNTPVCKLEIKP
jgi:hypothetical protein